MPSVESLQFGELPADAMEGMSKEEIQKHRLAVQLQEFDIEGEHNRKPNPILKDKGTTTQNVVLVRGKYKHRQD